MNPLVALCALQSTGKTIGKGRQDLKEAVRALSAADRFLYDWAVRDSKDAEKVVLKSAPQYDKNSFVGDITGLSNPHHECFEVIGITSYGNRRCTFLSRVSEYYSRMKWKGIIPGFQLPVVKSGRVWLVIPALGEYGHDAVNVRRRQVVSEHYLRALRGANDFLNNWRVGRKKSVVSPINPWFELSNKSLVQKYIALPENTVRAFCVHDGISVGEGKYVFNVVLYSLKNGHTVTKKRTHLTMLIHADDPDESESWRAVNLP